MGKLERFNLILIRATANVCTATDLDLGWLDGLITQANNSIKLDMVKVEHM
jgi:hypothetical protein